MAIRHIVTWKLAATDGAAKREHATEIAARLEPLVDVIPGTRSLQVSENSAYHDVNWDVVLIGEYDDLAALDAYQGHPEHQAAAAFVRSVVSDRASIDFEI
ncbi:Dabb family protein [Saxibacter everestensis]|uniref:Dabb family protein n=1 Tax=Saxibacter everestensis TaxID=2909229 RepID=A0ABY8QT13_9MICO|nr:Dabb family protein [Brevibacteriaceae bacterium ZFBP1038]